MQATSAHAPTAVALSATAPLSSSATTASALANMHVNHTLKHSERAALLTSPSTSSSSSSSASASRLRVGLPELLGSRLDGTVPLSRSLAPHAAASLSLPPVTDVIALSNTHVNNSLLHSERAASLSSPPSFDDLPPLIADDFTGTGAILTAVLRLATRPELPYLARGETLYNKIALEAKMDAILSRFPSLSSYSLSSRHQA